MSERSETHVGEGANPKIAFVLGWDDGQTVQYEGIVDEPAGDELIRVKRAYLAKFPDGVERESWPGTTYFRARPTWLRYSDFRGAEPTKVTVEGSALGALVEG